jgi:NAD(P)H-hydrate epimerase
MTLPPYQLVPVAAMSELDRRAIEGWVPLIDLVGRAAAAVASAIQGRYIHRSTLVICGKGNNGADGFVTAALLADAGWPVTVASTVPREELKGDQAIAASRWTGPIAALTVDILDGQQLVVDALYGAGLNRPILGGEQDVLREIARRGLDTVAIDIPSGVKGDTGEIAEGGEVAKAALTVTFHRKKPGHVLLPGRGYCGDVVVADIGLPDSESQPDAIFENLPELWRDSFPWPVGDTNKYKRGHALVVGGDMTGAGRLAAHAAQRIGAGLVTVACPQDCKVIYSSISPSLIVQAVQNAGGVSSIIADRHVKAILAGPGGGIGDALADTIRAILDSGLPAVLDADALSVLATQPELRSRLKPHHILTPHEGEFKRLFDFEGSRIERARRAANESSATILLKGTDTIIAEPNGHIAVNSNATPWLATAGSGDTLAGFIVGLLAQGMTPFLAACTGAWMHGECARSFGPGLIADDLAGQVPAVLKRLLARQ